MFQGIWLCMWYHGDFACIAAIFFQDASPIENLVLVSHGLLMRVFCMVYFHWTVEDGLCFEHCLESGSSYDRNSTANSRRSQSWLDKFYHEIEQAGRLLESCEGSCKVKDMQNESPPCPSPPLLTRNEPASRGRKHSSQLDTATAQKDSIAISMKLCNTCG